MNALTAAAAAAVVAAPAVSRQRVVPHQLSFFKPISSFSFRYPCRPLRFQSFAPTRASLRNPNHENLSRSSKLLKFQIPSDSATSATSSRPILAMLRAALVTAVTTAALLFTGYTLSVRPSVAALNSSPPPTVETSEGNSVSDEEKEKSIEEHLLSHPNDVDGLKNLMELKIKSKKVEEAIEIVDRLIELEPGEVEWSMLKSHLYSYNGDVELARNGFNELLNKDPFRVEAYHGLVTIASQEESGQDIENIEKRVEEAMELCKKSNKMSDLRDFKLLLAQIRVIQGSYDEALKLYDELVKEEPMDFRPYLCQGIIYTLLRKSGEAEKKFEKYRRLVPKGHPYATYFDDNLIATKIFAEKMENERAMAKN